MRQPAHPLVGRDHETRLIAAALESSSPAGRALILRGEAGVGKTALLHRALEMAEAAGYVCVLVRAPGGGSLPIGFPIAQILSGVDEGLTTRGGKVPPSLRTLIETPEGGGKGRAPDLLQVAAALEAAAEICPLAMFLDDLQWTPPAAREFLFAMLRALETPVLFVATMRRGGKGAPEEAALPEPSADLVLSRIDLSGLDMDACHQLAASELEAPVLPSLTQMLFERSLGNPLFLLETLRNWRQSGLIGPGAGGYWGFSGSELGGDSPSLTEIIAQRLGGLNPEAIEVGTGMAVLGRPARFDELARATRQGPDQLAESLSVLDDAGLMEAEPPADTYRLSHPLFQTTLLASMSETRQASWHERLFNALADPVGRANATELAFHAVRCLRQPANISDLLESAAREAADAGSYSEAADWYQRLAETVEDEDARTIATLGLAAALEHFDPDKAEELYGSALEQAGTGHDKVKILIGRARVLRMLNRHEDALAALRQGAPLARGEESFEIRDATAIVLGSIGRYEEAGRELHALIRESKGTPVEKKALGHLLPLTYVQGRLRDAIEYGLQALEANTDPEQRINLINNLGWLSLLAGDWKEADAFLDDGIAWARRTGDVWFLIPLLDSATKLAAWQGDFDESMDRAAELQKLRRKTTSIIEQICFKEAVGLALLEKGDDREALAAMKGLRELIPLALERHEVANETATLALACLRNGDLETAAMLAAQAREDLRFNATWKQTVDRLDAQILLEKGDAAGASSLLDPWLSQPGPIRLEQAWMMELAAHACQELDRSPESLSHAQEAHALYEGLGARHRAERTARWIEQHTPRRKGRPRSGKPGDLTDREGEILSFIAQGKTNAEIGRSLVISHSTVKKHVENIKVKLGVHRRTELAVISVDIERKK